MKSPIDWLVEFLLYGLGGGLLGLGLACVILARFHFTGGLFVEILFAAVLTVMGLAAGLFFGERGVNWLGRQIRENEGR